MPLMSQKKQPFIIDEDLGAALKPYLPADSRTTVECGMRKRTPDYPFLLDLCQREEAMLVTADTGFPKQLRITNETFFGDDGVTPNTSYGGYFVPFPKLPRRHPRFSGPTPRAETSPD
jgi:hypothetical protein